MKGRRPTAAEDAHMNHVAELGCIVCRLHMQTYTPCEIHHTDGKTKSGAHFKTLGLCHWHHRGGNDCESYTSRHPYKAEFEARYGSEEELMAKTKELIEGL